MTKEELIPYIKEKIKNNTSGDITGNVLQKVLEEIVNQDPIKAVAAPPRMPYQDCNVLSILAKALEAGTLFDVILVFDDGGVICQGKILGYEGTTLYFYDVINKIIDKINILYSPAQYTALSAVQLECDRIAGTVSDYIPNLEEYGNGFVMESESGSVICNPDGYKYVVTAADGKITSISVSGELVEGAYIVLDEETAQDLIGLPIE